MSVKFYQIYHHLSRDLFSAIFLNLRRLKITIANLVYGFFYNLTWGPAKLVFSFFAHFKVKSRMEPEKLKKLKGPLIIVSNHGSWIDPFIIGAALPFCSRLFPIRFACWYKHYYKPGYYVFARVYGTFPVMKKIGLKESLKIPLKILKDKGVIGLFPEGKRHKRGRQPRGRRGAAYLAIKTRAKLLPIQITGGKNMGPFRFFLGHYKIKVKIGEPFKLPYQRITRPQDLNKPTALIMKKINEL